MKKMNNSKTIHDHIEDRSNEVYVNQVATIVNSDWNIFLSPAQIDSLMVGKTTTGRHMGFSFLKERTHGLGSSHSGFTSQYVDFCKMCHEKGLTIEDWKVIADARSGSPLANNELDSNTTTFGNNWKK